MEGGDCLTQMCLVMLLSATWELLLVLYLKFLKNKHGDHVVKFSSN